MQGLTGTHEVLGWGAMSSNDIVLGMYIGPDRRPMQREPRVYGGSHYHGRVPRSLLGEVGDGVPWNLAAPLVEAALWGHGAGSGAHGGDEGVGEAAAWVAAARRAGMVSLRAGMEIARAVAARVADQSGHESGDLWLVKEGHTATVWQLQLGDEVLGISVSRDAVAAAELAAAAGLMRRWRGRAPDRVVDVYAVVREMFATGQGAVEATAVVGEWVTGMELHVPADPGRRFGLLAVGWLAGASGDARAWGQQVFGRWLADDEAARTWAALGELMVALAEPGPHGWMLPSMRINEGDIMIGASGPTIVAAEAMVAAEAHDLARMHPALHHSVLDRLERLA